eukprot:COSAG06_NODE_18622_length_877_cov_0.939589_1_plen_134_part_00
MRPAFLCGVVSSGRETAKHSTKGAGSEAKNQKDRSQGRLTPLEARDVQGNSELFFLLDRVVDELTNQYGQPISSYTLRPGQDGRRVWTSFTDASRADVRGGPEIPDRAEGTGDSARDDGVKFGAGGGWFRLWG